MKLFELPIDVWDVIRQYLTRNDLLRLRAVCMDLSKYVKSLQYYWRIQYLSITDPKKLKKSFVHNGPVQWKCIFRQIEMRYDEENGQIMKRYYGAFIGPDAKYEVIKNSGVIVNSATIVEDMPYHDTYTKYHVRFASWDVLNEACPYVMRGKEATCSDMQNAVDSTLQCYLYCAECGGDHGREIIIGPKKEFRGFNKNYFKLFVKNALPVVRKRLWNKRKEEYLNDMQYEYEECQDRIETYENALDRAIEESNIYKTEIDKLERMKNLYEKLQNY